MNRKSLIVIIILFSAGLIYWVLQTFFLQLEPGYLQYKIHKSFKEQKSGLSKSHDVAERIRSKGQFDLWVTGCAHMLSDFERGRLGIKEAVAQSSGMGGAEEFDWDIMLNLGDFVAFPYEPDNFQGELAARQLEINYSRKHLREHIYCLMGNHDAWTVDSIPEKNYWFRKWIDPLGEHPETSGVANERRPFVVEGNYERYAFQAGNVLFLMLSDNNDGEYPIGRSNKKAGCPAGAITEETFEWWKSMVMSNQDKIIITAHHQLPRETTIATAPYEGTKYKYHGQCSPDDVKGSSYLYFIGDDPNSDQLTDFLEANPGCIDLWLGAHTHISPLDTLNGRTFCEQKYGVTFVNCAQLFFSPTGPASSRKFEFKNGDDQLLLRTYIHKSDSLKTGFLSLLDKKIPLRHAFRFE